MTFSMPESVLFDHVFFFFIFIPRQRSEQNARNSKRFLSRFAWRREIGLDWMAVGELVSSQEKRLRRIRIGRYQLARPSHGGPMHRITLQSVVGH